VTIVDDVFLIAGRGVVVTCRAPAAERTGFVCGRAARILRADGTEHLVEVGPVEPFARLVSGPAPEPRTFAFVVRGVSEPAEIPIGSEIVIDA